MRKFLMFILLLFPITIHADNEYAKSASAAIMIESSTGDVIYEKNSKEKLAPASMTNIMTT